MRILTILTAILFISITGLAQKQDNVWCMGFRAGVNFNTTPPSGFSSQINAIETTAAISNRNTGALLFYTDGHKIWDATHNLMPNGTDIGVAEQAQSTVQGAVIIPFIHDDTKYYVFALETFPGRLYYSVVDMKLNNGLGDVVPSVKKVFIAEDLTEGMVALQGCEMTWVVTQNINSGEFYAHKVSADGVEHQPVVSSADYPTALANAICIKASPDSRKIATASIFAGLPKSYSYLALHDFDAATGKVSNGRMADTTARLRYYNCEFSPNSKFLYSNDGDTVFQYDISLATKQAITASKMVAGFPPVPGALTGMQLRTDGNIYIARNGRAFLDMLTDCDARAPGCTYVNKAAVTGGNVSFNLPAAPVMPRLFSTGVNTSTGAAVCNGKPLVLKANKQNVTWQDGSKGENYTVTQPGIYWVRGHTADCKANTDTFVVDDVSLNVAITNDTTICTGDTIVLQSNAQPAGATYLWSNGSTKDNIEVTDTGVYSLTISHNGCEDIDETTISHYPAVSIELGADTVICNDVQITLPQKTVAEEVDKYLWQDGSTAATLQVTASGRYFVTISSRCGAVSDTVTITKRNCSLYFPGAFSPNGDGKNDIARILGDVAALTDFTLNIYNRWGQKVFTTANPLQGWNGMHGASLADIGVYYYYMQYKYKGEAGSMKGDVTLVR